MPGAPAAAGARGAGTATRGAGRGSTPRGRRPDDPANWIEDPAKKAKRDEAQRAMRNGPPPGMPPAAPAGDEPESGFRPKPAGSSKSAASLPRPSLEPGDGAGFLLGLFAYAMVVSYISYGPAGPAQWLRAKFLNQPGSLAKSSSSTPTKKPVGGTPATRDLNP
jgi:hypothetical protein